MIPQWTENVKVLQNTVTGHPYERRYIYLKGISGCLSDKLDHNDSIQVIRISHTH